METKHEHTSELINENENSMISLFLQYAQLKNLYRQGWLKRGVSRIDCETVADHSFGVALLGYTIAVEHRPDLDPLKVMTLGLFHEVGEIYAGDITPKDGVSVADKTEMELNGVQKLFSILPNPEEYIGIWEEFEYQKSPEAIFVKQIDKLEMALQAGLYERRGYDTLGEFFESVQGKINSPELKSILEDLVNSR